MVGRLLRRGGTVLAVVCGLVVPILVTGPPPASADTVVDGCTIVSNPTSTNFTNCPGANLGDANLSGVNLSYADFAGADFVDCSVISGTDCNAADLSGATLTDANLSSATFFDSIPYSPCGVPSCLEIVSGAASLSGADLAGADLSSAQLHNVDLTDAVLTDANLTSATFTGCVSNTTPCQSGATLTGANFTGATLTDVDFSGTLLVPADQSVFGTSTGAVVTWPAPQALPGATPGSCSATSGTNFPLGTTTVTCQVLDDQGDTATGTFTVEVSQVGTTAGLTSSVSGPVGVGALVAYTDNVGSSATASPPPLPTGGTVDFTEDGSTITGCSAVPLVAGNPAEASCSVTFATTGSHVIQAIYSGSGIFEGDESQELTQDVVSTTPPTTSVVLPSNGATVAGNVWLDAEASSPVGVASVSFELTGNGTSNTVIAKATPTEYGWLAEWNSTALDSDVANGTFTLQSVVTDEDGTSSTSAPITVTVDNPLATTAVIIPSAGATQSGSAALLDATTTGNSYYSTEVYELTYELSGGPSNLSDQTIATGTATLYGWLAQWNTEAVPNGTYTLQSVGFYRGGAVTSAPVTISVDNAPPTTTVLVPSSGADVSGTSSVLDAGTSANVTSVSYELSGGSLSDQVIATGTLTYYGWLAEWNTTSVPDGTYSLQSVASYGGGVSGTSAPITITVDN
jgi:Bacterial Ig-like domain (group 3)/Pentapeptide repeats (8 copies)/Bacterial Ig domain/HYR domain